MENDVTSVRTLSPTNTLRHSPTAKRSSPPPTTHKPHSGRLRGSTDFSSTIFCRFPKVARCCGHTPVTIPKVGGYRRHNSAMSPFCRAPNSSTTYFAPLSPPPFTNFAMPPGVLQLPGGHTAPSSISASIFFTLVLPKLPVTAITGTPLPCNFSLALRRYFDIISRSTGNVMPHAASTTKGTAIAAMCNSAKQTTRLSARTTASSRHTRAVKTSGQRRGIHTQIAVATR